MTFEQQQGYKVWMDSVLVHNESEAAEGKLGVVTVRCAPLVYSPVAQSRSQRPRDGSLVCFSMLML